MANQHQLDGAFLHMAKTFSLLSHCASKQVAAITVRDGRIVSTGINGTPAGVTNCDELYDRDILSNPDHPDYAEMRKAHMRFSDENEIHAEMNAIAFAAKVDGSALDGATMYCTLEPCRQCLKNMVMAGIKRVVFLDKYDRLCENDRMNVRAFCDEIGISLEQWEA